MNSLKVSAPKLLLLALLTMAGEAAAGHRTFSKQERAMMGSTPVVFATYFKIASALAHDSTDGIRANALAIADAIRRDHFGMLPAAVVAEADALAQAKGLFQARIVFKELSKSLVRYRADWKITGKYKRVECPVAKASWLQKNGTEIENPYLGKKKPRCGIVIQPEV